MIGQARYGLDWLNAAVGWGEYRNVPVNIWRDGLGEWCVTLTFRDSRGIFHSEPLRMPEQVTRAAIAKVEKRLDDLSAATRKARIGLRVVV